MSKSIKLIKASSSDMKSTSSRSSGSSGTTSEAEEVDTEGQHSLQVEHSFLTEVHVPQRGLWIVSRAVMSNSIF